MSDNRTEKATPKRREDARKRGQVARRGELPTSARFLASLFVLQIMGEDFVGRAERFFQTTFAHVTDRGDLTALLVQRMLLEAAGNLAILSLPVMLVGLAASLAGNFAQGGLTFSVEALAPKAERLNPAANLKRLFSPDTAVDLIKNVLKLAGICAVSYAVFAGALKEAPSHLNTPAAQTLGMMATLAYGLSLRVGVALFALALLDYGYGWFKHEKSLRMTKQEIKDEYKQQEGDPMVKGQRRRMARKLAMQRMMADVKNADVVIANPTHYAIALRYDRERDAAPIIVAKGIDSLALRIRAIAEEHSVAVVENPPLARALYAVVEVGQIIPADFFRTIAEVLAYVYLRRAESAR
jgi:flagellar biosynthetic protein FlhB